MALGNMQKAICLSQRPSGQQSSDSSLHTSEERGNTLAWSFLGKLKPEVRSTSYSTAVACTVDQLGQCQDIICDICHSVRGANIQLQEKMSFATKGKANATLLLPWQTFVPGRGVLFVNYDINEITVRCVSIKLETRCSFNVQIFFQSTRGIMHRKILLMNENGEIKVPSAIKS